MTDTFKASISGILNNVNTTVELDIQDIGDSFPNALAVHEFPFLAGAMLQNMGAKGRQIKFRAFFIGTAYANHEVLLNILKSLKAKELIHPKYGVIKGDIAQIDVRHTNYINTAEVDISFYEGLIKSEPVAADGVPGSVEDAFLDGQDEAADALEDDISGDLESEGTGICRQTLDASKGILEQFTGLTSKARAYVGQVETSVRTLESTLTSITSPANSIISTVTYAANLPGRVVGAAARCVERYAESYTTLRSFPRQFTSSLRQGLLQLEQSFSSFQSKAPAGSARAVTETAAMAATARQINFAASQRLALEAAYAFQTDQQARQEGKRNEDQRSFDNLGNYLNPTVPDRFMNAPEIEAVLAEVMTAAQRSVEADRSQASIKKATAALVDHAWKIKLEMERIYAVEIDNMIPVHLLCLKYGLPYNAAERVLAINPGVKHPNFISGTVNIYAQ